MNIELNKLNEILNHIENDACEYYDINTVEYEAVKMTIRAIKESIEERSK